MSKVLSIFVVTLFCIGLATAANAGVPVPFPGEKVLDDGPDPVGIGKDTSTTFIYTINLNSCDDTQDVVDVVEANFDVGGDLCAEGPNLGDSCTVDSDCGVEVAGDCDVGGTNLCTAGNIGAGCASDAECDVFFDCGDSLLESCGLATAEEEKKAGDKLRPDVITWDLTSCGDCSGGETLTVSIVTDLNPGHGKRGIMFYEPTSCGPKVINDGAVLTGNPETEPSNSLIVATCLDETDLEGCVDGDDDFWSVDCGDCNDADPAINPGVAEVCGDGIDNNCDENIDEGCPQCSNSIDDDSDGDTDYPADAECADANDNDESA